MAALAHPPQNVDEILAIESALIFPEFTADTAWELGNALRTRLLDFPTPAVVNIALANNNQLLFHCATRPGTLPDNDSWVSRKRKVVLRWGRSTWAMHNKFAELAYLPAAPEGPEGQFAGFYQLGDTAGEYAIHGGGFPVRVKGVEGVVGAIVVSGLRQEWDHQVIVETVQQFLKNKSAT
ncbi:UPF0303 protein [Mycena indigotica]|uniref:UPF0303 protein n=1 Tax=Mycena indigotica TaxID=2126181 RepID=A0A8H6TD23_9AGAR|nr:UPF0303 protein [Mycena indigotica]KAF7316363.1 UPF0303 protein [Mycena indigotica]